ncbi:PAS domain S-box protein [Nostoc sp. CHAB 5715]|uniref:PAS domain S-box protein n=1 Tax=Nostoc sp. CHAB 5715 TaxID=2780400 RepID=UPI001E56B705|nr:PAS domain S-box protein [Nostoc sp. CHAB 5715]MCC5621091.1 PAS domain S-box protein [Nostoc sp. CHAB 5715]
MFETRGNTSISSFEVEHHILVESQLLKYKWLLVRAIVPKDTTGEPARLIEISVDITSCVQAEVLFRESERRFRPIFNSSFQFIGLLITEGIVLEVNQTALHLGELQPQDVVERPYWKIWWTLLLNQQHLQYLLSSSPGVIYTCKSYADFGSTFIRENVVAIRSYQVREMLKGTSFWASELHSLLESFSRTININNILGIGLGMKVLKK